MPLISKDRPISVRAFCMEHDINYQVLHNSFKADRMGMGLVNSFKKAVPDLNMNWFLYGEGEPLLSHARPNENINT